MALFTWKAIPKERVGEERVVRRFVLCRTLNGETRCLGLERIRQQLHLYNDRMGIDRIYWRDMEWADR